MPGRLLGIFNRTSSKSDSVPKGPNLNQSDGGGSDSGKGPKKVSFDTKVKFKKFKLGRRQKAGERQGHHHPPNREENHVVAYLFPGPFRSSSSRKRDGVATSSATNEFWFNVNRRPTKPDDSGREPAALDLKKKEEEEKKSEISLDDSPPSPPDRPTRRRRRRRSLPKMLQSPSTSTYNYDLDPSLHPSQQPSEMPRVKRNLVRNIVAQFNEEARKRDSYTSNENLAEIRTTSPNLIEATPENAPNQNRPFSYMVGNNGSLPSSGSTTMGQRSKSEYNILQSQPDVIYAKVVVNGKTGSGGKSEGKYKTTVHTKVPNRSTTKFSSNTLGNSARTDGRSAQPPFDDSKKYFSKSMGNLLLDDGDRSSDHHQTTPKSRQNGKKTTTTTDNSYYKFDPVDDEFVRQGGSIPNGRSKEGSRTNGHHREVSSSSSSVSRQQQRKTRRNSSGIESDEDDRRFPLLSHQGHSMSKFQDSANQGRKSSSPGQYETRNVEKWSENEVGPNSRKYTEHEYIHEVSMSGDDHQQRGDRMSKSRQDKSFWNSMERKGSKWTSDADLSGSASSLSKRSSTNKQRSRGSPPGDILRIDDRDDVLTGGRYRSPNRVLLRSRSGGDSDGAIIDRDVKSRPLLSSPGYRKSTTIKEDTVEKTFTKATPPSKSPSGGDGGGGLSQYYFGQSDSLPKVEGQKDVRYTSESLHDSWRNHHHVSDLRKNSSSSSHFQRRGSSDSGSGVGLLSSKLVKKANAEVNGGGGKRNGLNYGSAEHLIDDGGENVSGRRRRQQQQQRRLSETDSNSATAVDDGKLSPPPPPWSMNLGSRNLGNDVVDTFSKYENESRQVAGTPPNPLGGYTTEERRVIRKEETKRTTRREVRTTTPVSAGDDEDDQDEEKLFLEHHRQIHNEDKYSDTDQRRRRESGERRSTLEREQRQSKGKAYGHDSYWNENNNINKKIQDGKSERLFQKSDRKIHVDVADQQNNTTMTSTKKQRHQHHHHHHSERAFSDEMEDKMETSGSEPQLYSGSQDSRMSLGSHVSSAEEEDADQRVNQHHQHLHQGRTATEDIIAAHVNTPQSMVKQMNKQQISYENSQQQQSSRDRRQETTGGTSGRRFWFERSADEEEDIRRAHTRLDKQDINRNHYHHHQYNNKNNNTTTNNNNNTWTSATMSRLESNKNRRNYQDEELVNKVNTVDRRDRRHQRSKAEDIRIQLNDRDVMRNGHSVSTDGKRSSSVDRSPSFNSRVGSYHSENESQHSAGSSGSAKKRVNFKSRHGGGGGGKNGHSSSNFGSRSDLSPMHREALMRSASPARAPSTSGSLKSNDSEASQGSSNKSVILHATAVADIPPAREYQYRSATISPTPPPSVIGSSSSTTPGVSRETRTVQRSFSLLSPWKPRKYKEKYDKRSNVHKSSEHLENGHHHHHEEEEQDRGRTSSFDMESRQRPQAANHQARRETASSRGSSSEKLDSLPPLPSEEAPVSSKSKNKKKSSGLLRRHSMPKDSRFANFFRRKKEAKK